ncbi:MAG: LptF/LptG family permease, partial [Elusimicrobiota bacterium]
MDRVFQLVNLVINKGVDFVDVLLLLFYSIPTIITLTMPMGTAAAGILTFGQMASDGEITAIRTSGSTLKPVVGPVIIFTLFIGVLMYPFNYFVAPTSQFAFRKNFSRIAFKNPTVTFEEGTIIEIDSYTLFSQKINRDKKLLK